MKTSIVLVSPIAALFLMACGSSGSKSGGSSIPPGGAFSCAFTDSTGANAGCLDVSGGASEGSEACAGVGLSMGSKYLSAATSTFSTSTCSTSGVSGTCKATTPTGVGLQVRFYSSAIVADGTASCTALGEGYDIATTYTPTGGSSSTGNPSGTPSGGAFSCVVTDTTNDIVACLDVAGGATQGAALCGGFGDEVASALGGDSASFSASSCTTSGRIGTCSTSLGGVTVNLRFYSQPPSTTASGFCTSLGQQADIVTSYTSN